MCFFPSRVTRVDLPVIVAGKHYLILKLEPTSYYNKYYDIFENSSVHRGESPASGSLLSFMSNRYTTTLSLFKLAYLKRK